MTKRVNITNVQNQLRTEETKRVEEEKLKGAKTHDSFVNYESNLGLQANNAMSTSTYGFNPITRQRVLLEWIYRGSWLGGVAVDIRADDMTRNGVELLGELPPDSIQLIEEEVVRLNIWTKLNETLKWSNLYGGALLVLLIDGQDVSKPLRLNSIKEGQFAGVMPMDRWQVDPTTYDLVTEIGPNLGEPKYYRVLATAPALVGQKIHYTRVIRFEGIKLPYWQRALENMWGLSVIERMYDRMVAFDSTTTGAAQLVYKSYIRNYKIKDMRSISAQGGDALIGLKKYVDQMRQWQGIEGMTMLDAEDDFGADAHTAFGGLSDIMTRFMEQCAGALRIPLCRLFGQSPSGFSTGDTDIRNYYDTVKQEQERDLLTGVTLIYRLIASSLGFELPKGFGISFRSLYLLNDTEKADIASKNINSIAVAYSNSLISREIALKELKQQAKVSNLFTNVTDEVIAQAAKEKPIPSQEERVATIRAKGMVDSTRIRTKEANKSKDTEPLNAPTNTHDKAYLPAEQAYNPHFTVDKAFLPIVPVRAAGIVFITKGKRMLIMERAEGENAGKWECPGGHLEAGESAEMGARRESFEETGVAYFGPLAALPTDDDFVTFVAYIDAPFDVKICDEHLDFKWANFSELNTEYPLHPGLSKQFEEYIG